MASFTLASFYWCSKCVQRLLWDTMIGRGEIFYENRFFTAELYGTFAINDEWTLCFSQDAAH